VELEKLKIIFSDRARFDVHQSFVNGAAEKVAALFDMFGF
jgi:hypothetical protein